MLLFDELVDRAIGFHFLDFFEPGDGALNGVEISEGASQPAFGDVMLAASFGRFPHRFLGLLFGAHEEHLPALAHRPSEKIAGGFQLGEGFAEVNDMNPVARFKDELLHLGIPSFGLVSEMDARVQ